MDNIEFTPTPNRCKYEANSASEWLSLLKSRWDLSVTTMRENEFSIVITYCRGGKHMVLVAEYDKMSKTGYVLDSRKEVRSET